MARNPRPPKRGPATPVRARVLRGAGQWWLHVLCLLAACLAAGDAGGHTRSASHSFWEIDGRQAEVRTVISEVELTRLGLSPGQPGYRRQATELLAGSLQLLDANGPCRQQATLPAERHEGRLTMHWRLTCQSAPRAIRSRLFADGGVVHTHFASLRAGAAQAHTALLTPSRPRWQLPSGNRAAAEHRATAAPTGFGAFLGLGVQHILTGWDHLAFLLALVVLATSLRELAWLVTGFTLGHSLTLGLAVLGLARPAAGPVEAFIALSIVLVALDNAARLQQPGQADKPPERGNPGGSPPAPPRPELLRPAQLLALATVLLLLGGALGALPPLVVAGLLLAGACYLLLADGQRDAHAPRLALSTCFGLFHGFGFAGFLTGMQLPDAALLGALVGFNLGVELGQLLLLALAWPLLTALARRGLPVGATATAAAAGLGLHWYLLRLLG